MTEQKDDPENSFFSEDDELEVDILRQYALQLFPLEVFTDDAYVHIRILIKQLLDKLEYDEILSYKELYAVCQNQKQYRG